MRHKCTRIDDYRRAGLLPKTPPTVSSLIPFHGSTFTMSIATELVAVQPMSLPAGMLFYMDYRYEPKSDLDPSRSFIRNPGPCDSFHIISGGTKIVDPARFPHRCPRCGAPAYIGLMNVECSDGGCR